MTDHCTELDAHLDGLLEGERGEAFARHLDDCVACRAAVERWNRVAPVLTELGGNAERLVRRAQERRARTRRLRWVVGLAAAIGAVAILGGVLLSLDTDEVERETGGSAPAVVTAEPLEAEVLVPRTDDGALEIAQGALFEAADADRLLVRIGRDLIGLAPGGRVRVAEAARGNIRLALEHGAVACLVEPRRGDEAFVVAVGPTEVRVVGTRFVVSAGGHAGLEVAVAEGAVEVITPGRASRRVDAGRSLVVASGADPEIREFDAAHQELLNDLLAETPAVPTDLPTGDEPAPIPPDLNLPRAETKAGKGTLADVASTPAAEPEEGGLALWRSWIKQGRLEDAERALVDHLDGSPGDHGAWSLLASCRRKRGNWSGACDAHRRVIELAPAGKANRARFMAASILQDRLGDKRAAASLLQGYLDDDGGGTALTAEAMVRLARCHLALGRPAPARRLLERVVRDHGGTTMATEARRLLAELGPADAEEHGEETDK